MGTNINSHTYFISEEEIEGHVQDLPPVLEDDTLEVLVPEVLDIGPNENEEADLLVERMSATVQPVLEEQSIETGDIARLPNLSGDIELPPQVEEPIAVKTLPHSVSWLLDITRDMVRRILNRLA